MHIAVVIPIFNERPHLPEALARLAPFVRLGGQVILVDGGSTDGTPALAEKLGYSVIQSAPGRARQMNTGAQHSAGDALLFLHIDTYLPEGWQQQVSASLAGHHCWGRFDVRIVGQSAMLKVVARMMNLRSRYSGIATGDQTIFMTRDAFKRVGGFPDQPLMEDIEMSKRLKLLSRPVCLTDEVTTSGRRWDSQGVWTTIFLMWRLRFAYWCGRSASQLAKAYQ